MREDGGMIHTVAADYSQFYIHGVDGWYDPDNIPEELGAGLVQADTHSNLMFVSFQQWGDLPIDVRVLDAEPAITEETWHDVVELSITPPEPMVLDGWEDVNPLDLGLEVQRSYRVRYSVKDADLARDIGTQEDAPFPESYLIEIWPAPVSPPRVVRGESANGQYWTFQRDADRAKLAVSDVPNGAKTAAIVEIGLTEHPEVARRIARGEAQFQSGILAYAQKIYPHEMEYDKVQELVDHLARSREW